MIADPGQAALNHRSPFTGADMIDAAGWAALPGAVRPIFDQDVWDLSGVLGLPSYLTDYQMVWDFTEVVHLPWRLVLKELMFACLVPDHLAVRHLNGYRHQPAPATCVAYKNAVAAWLSWLSSDGVSSMSQITQHHCDRYLAYRRHVYDQQGRPVRGSTASHQRAVVTALRDLAVYSELFTADRYPPGMRPWQGKKPARVVGYKPPKENTTPPVPLEILQPLLASSLYIVETLGPRIVDLQRARADNTGRPEQVAPMRPRPGADDIARALEGHRAAGEPLVEIVPWRIQHRLDNGWDPCDPLLRVSFQALADREGCGNWRQQWLDADLRTLTEQTMAVVGLAKPWARNADPISRADGQGLVAWTEPLHTREISRVADIVSQASLTVVAALSGMRSSELTELLVGCRRTTEIAPGLMRYRLASKVIKGRPLGGQDDEWVVLEEVHHAIALAEQLVGGQAGASLFGRVAYPNLYASSLRPWINGPAGRRLGLEPIPEGPVSARMLRSRLAIEMAYRPNGLLAAKTHLRHLSVATTEGYANRPGGSQAKLLAEVREHEQERNHDLLLAEFRNYQNGIRPSGPGARHLITYFEHIDGQINDAKAAPPKVKASDQEIRNLLATRAGILHLGTANYCWFADPAKALCLKLAGTPTADKPLAGMCDSARCSQATHHPCHRPVWADTITNTTTFLGTLGRANKVERVRLQAELDRAQRVVDDIDAAVSRASGDISEDH